MRFHHRAVPIVLSAVLIDTIGFGIVIPVLPSLIVDLGRVSLTEATRIGGYMLIAFAAAQFVAGPILGSMGDRFGRRPVILAAMLAFAIDYGLMAWAPTLGWLFVGRLIAGLTGAVYGPANAVLADVTPSEQRGATFGLMGAAFGLGFILGPAIGGLISEWGTRAPFIVASLLALANAVWIALALPETLDPEHRRPFDWKRANALGAFQPLLHAGGAGAVALILTSLLWQLGHMVYPATWAFWAEIRLGWDAQAIGWSLAAVGLGMALVQVLLTGRAIARFGEERTVVIGMSATIIAFVGFVFVLTGWQVYILLAISALQGLVFPSINALLSRMVDRSNQGALQGGMSSVGSIAAVIGPLAMTQALAAGAEQGQPSANFILASMLVAGALLVVWFGVVRRLPPRPVVA